MFGSKLSKSIAMGTLFIATLAFQPFSVSAGANNILPRTIQLAAPTILHPKTNQVLKNFPRKAFLKWTAVSAAVSYEVQVQCDICNIGTKPMWSAVEVQKVVKGTTYVTKPLSGDNNFRFHVRAINGKGEKSTWSDFTYFSYKTTKVKPPILPIKPIALEEDCLSFDSAKVKIGLDNNGYVMTDGRSRMKVFKSATEAEMAMKIITEYKMNKHCFVGRGEGNEPMEYWLADNIAPSGNIAGEDCLSFKRLNVAIENHNGKFTLVDGSHWILASEGLENAKKTKAAWDKHDFNQICFVGRPGPSMTYYKSSPKGD